jgi:hypothetical protein
MSNNLSKRQPDEPLAMTEDELQEKYKDDPSPLIQAALAARRENLRIEGRLWTVEEILAEVRGGRGVSAQDEE